MVVLWSISNEKWSQILLFLTHSVIFRSSFIWCPKTPRLRSYQMNPWKSHFLMLFRTTNKQSQSFTEFCWVPLISLGVSFKSGIRLRNEHMKAITASSFVIFWIFWVRSTGSTRIKWMIHKCPSEWPIWGLHPWPWH